MELERCGVSGKEDGSCHPESWGLEDFCSNMGRLKGRNKKMSQVWRHKLKANQNMVNSQILRDCQLQGMLKNKPLVFQASWGITSAQWNP